ncbi:tRNA lysidine(34) synthetase TilS [Flaviaesturariibacter aridisoli]|uniref:tRNA(Ile)-lysidine synthase n=1 Tax=Flaviaesturariibacter aridisoli TaxID=2545761 RepID=A0A4V2WMX3_9BACT|nr:tRNA lysidine(34) synthetase TilS [Flaviaesturariibacter aridisoli]TCZ73292.1 tRNA lysidine(34) synthetase TilS [Flaviaesturariibacter aridisoli]
MHLSEAFLHHIDQLGWNLTQKRLLLAVSGGLDSVVLAHLCREAGYDFAIAHCNFQLRGAESDADAAFVRALAATLAVPYFEKSFDTNSYSVEKKISIQVAARELRYAWFEELLQQPWGAHARCTMDDSFLLTAHHLDDSIETLLLNFFKGTGVAGLTGIPVQNGRVLRPLLFAGRGQIRAWADARALSWREDSSNSDTKYTRNALRNEVLPLLEKLFPQVRQNLAHNLERFAGLEAVYRSSIDAQLKKLLEWHGSEARVPVRKLLQATPLDTVLYELARPFGFTPGQTNGLRRLLDSGPGRYIDSATHRALRYGVWLQVVPLQGRDNRLHLLERNESSVLLDEQVLSWEEWTAAPAVMPPDPAIALLDARDIRFPLVVRRWKEGDYFYPLGMRKKKKLARFFIDSKLPRHLRERVWVVESHKKIVWVAGLRIDDRFKVTPATRKVLQLRLAAVSPSDNASLPAGSSERSGTPPSGTRE